MENQALIKFVREARKRGFDDYEIRKPLLDNGWPEEEVRKAFDLLKESQVYKNQVCIYLDNEVLKTIEKRAKRNLLSVNEQVEDIVRRSAVNAHSKPAQPEKLDDLLVTLFSRKTKKH